MAVVAGFAGGESQVGGALSFVVLAAALFPLAMKMWAMSDDAWEHWALEREAPAAVAAPPPPVQPASP